jgi:tetratricopeptide (TPR) repeat protein
LSAATIATLLSLSIQPELETAVVFPGTSATTLVVLAQALQAQGEMAEAETVLRRALAIREKALGPNHPDVAAVVATLGQIAFSQNRLKDAERDASRAIAIDESTFGRDNLNTALARMQLGNVRHRQLREAECAPRMQVWRSAFNLSGHNPIR